MQTTSVLNHGAMIAVNSLSKEKIGALLSQTSMNSRVVIPLKVSAAFHSPMMQSAVKEFEKELNNFQFKKHKFPVLFSTKNKQYAREFEIIPLLIQQRTKLVNWLAMTEYIRKTSTDCTIEFGLGKTLSRFAKDYENSIPHYHSNSLIANQIM